MGKTKITHTNHSTSYEPLERLEVTFFLESAAKDLCKSYAYWELPEYEKELQNSKYSDFKSKLDINFENKRIMEIELKLIIVYPVPLLFFS